MRKINLIVIHCSASDNPIHDDISVIKDWHLQRGFNDVGYHFFIKKNGTIQPGRPEQVIGSHVKGFNANSIGICLSGLHEFPDAQIHSCRDLVRGLLIKYGLELKDVVGHCDLFKGKTCPNFDYRDKILKNLL